MRLLAWAWTVNPTFGFTVTRGNVPAMVPTSTARLPLVSLLLSSSSSDASSTEKTTTEADETTVSSKPTKGCIVKIACRLEPEGDFVPEPLIDGIVMSTRPNNNGDESNTKNNADQDDTDSQPRMVDLHFWLGYGNYLPGLHDLVMDMVVGETRRNVSIDAGWGDRNPNLIATLSFQDSGMDPTQIKVGTQLLLAAPQKLPCIVTDVTETTFTIDANPPLAGASYAATVTLKSVEAGPSITPYNPTPESSSSSRYEVATFALGCFWGGELEFMRVPGVVGTAVGYTQGTVEDPTYQQVCSGTTGHTEAILVVYDPTKASYEMLVDVAMDRLGENKYLLNQVGNDKGTQYRHGVYYHTPEQEKVAQKVVGSFGADCVTECKPAQVFYFAEDYHQQYLLKGGQSARKGDTTVIRCYG